MWDRGFKDQESIREDVAADYKGRRRAIYSGRRAAAHRIPPPNPVKRLVIVVVLVLAASVGYRSFGSAETATGTLTLPQPAPTSGENAPNFEEPDTSGEDFELTDDGVYVLTFWSTLNKGSNDAQESFETLAREYGDDGVEFAAVYVSSTPKGDGRPYTTLQDSGGYLTSLYNVKRVPRLFVVKDGVITTVQNDYYEGVEKDLETEIQAALEREPR